MRKHLLAVSCLILTFFMASAVHAQSVVKGKVMDGSSGEALIGANILIKGTAEGTITDIDGNFSIKVSKFPSTLVVSYVGYDSKEVMVENANAEVVVNLTVNAALEEVTVVGSRFIARSAMESPVPVDNIKLDDLIQTGQQTFDKMLTYAVPAFNSTQQTISDATAHFDPADLRNLGPSRTLVLINGKRKNASSLVYINDTPGKGEVGVDMKSIPTAAIERVEVLRDGASAQYGSDAIAGVINVILRDDYEFTNINLYSGVTTEGDGFNIGYNVNTGFKLGQKGYLNVSASFTDQEETNRAGSPGTDALFGVTPQESSWITDNPDLGMRVGQPNMTTTDIFFNTKVAIDDYSEVYGFGGLTYRKGQSYALYRTPYWVPDPFNLLHAPGTTYQGFQPTFETDIFDNTLVAGVRGKKNDWNYDLSADFGSNTVDYNIGNTINPAMGNESPTTFYAGGYEFRHIVTNLDVARTFGIATLAFGTEFRSENFVAIAGEEASYFGSGAQSFPGLQPSNEIDANRYNVGFYTDLTLDITEDFLLAAAARYENYSDFGNNFTWKLNARYKFAEDKVTFRTSLSTGFRAPSLHQIYLSNIQTLVSGGTISNQGTFNNKSTVLRALQVPELKDETSLNFTIGTALMPTDQFSLTLDYYRIAMDDRVVFTSSIAASDPDLLVTQILQDRNITSLKFFTNAVNTISSGVDIVASYSDIALGAGSLNITASANFNNTKIDGQIATPAPIQAAGVDIFDRKEQSRILTARPNSKILLGLNYKVGKFTAVLNNTRFGEVTWQHATDVDKDQTFSAKVITDLNLNYQFNKTVGVTLGINNLFNVYPDEIDTKGDVVTDLGGRFKYPWEVNQFGFNGTTISGNLKITF